ncbi:MAG: alpha-glucosidase/alpha-galactosidase [Deltaproteobacteria bacterium]|nr:alpha-glucosidase/alpha-galactosidase [Deltaproteobacteria bacterium]MBI3388440.1 alpha-glucosidase/alpha-galactosidase [Deltaproteobacteria bacterium]
MPSRAQPKIALIGAGSVVFAKNLIGDILMFPELANCHIALMDIDAARLHTAERMTQKLAAALKVAPTITAHSDRRDALRNADFVINTIQVGGYRPSTVVDFEVPKRHHLRQTIADTLGIGGIMRALRTIPVLIEICRDMEAVCPNGLLLNYTNPMAMNCWALARATPITTVGLCHSVQGTAMELARDIGVPYGEITYQAAGINHMAFYLRFERRGEDLYPLIRKVVRDGRVPDNNRVRYEMLMRLGYFVTESSEHFAEYTPYFIRRDRPDLIERFNVPLDEYITRCDFMDQLWGTMREFFEGNEPIADVERSHEYGALIIHSIATGKPRVVYGNVPNRGLITNLQDGCCVEVPCLVNGNGIQPTRIGDLPPQLAGLIMTNVNVQSLAVEAALTGKREHVYHAAMLDPHTAAELTLDEIWQLVDDLIAAHGDKIPQLK